ncbi:MAG: putative membrane protein [Polaribacter sp.]|jgi:putative membrane protein
MKKLANILVATVAIEHIYFLVLDMFLWTMPIGLKTFNLTAKFAEQTASLAANQGLYNGFLAAGLIWSLFAKQQAHSLKVFFLSCIIVAAIFGALTAKFSILYIQGAPAILAILLVCYTQKRKNI